MLGAVKGDDAEEGVPLFRVLARRWKSLAPVKRERAVLASLAPADEQPKLTRVWVSKPRPAVYAHQKIAQAKPARGWNPWLWTK
jgi:hypothetical protein